MIETDEDVWNSPAITELQSGAQQIACAIFLLKDI